ncbi:hypothetical protein ACIHFE_22470 [Streptomyces sp. NPDC052396]|uniref:hypothetical protein n=1 Tax=Streptomyces sp. NPDC052396 TaxID=3365689 RepID=UPI0037D2D211
MGLVVGLAAWGAAGAMAPAQADTAVSARPVAPADATLSGPRLVFFNDNAGAPAGGSIGLRVLGMPSPWDEVTVTSPALQRTARLTPKSAGSPDSTEVYGPEQMQRLRADLRPGSYRLTAASHGRTVAVTDLTVTAQAKARINSFEAWPKAKHPGSRVTLCLIDEQAAPDEKSLTATSPAFDGPVKLTADSADDNACQSADGSDTLYSGHATVASGLAADTYPVTVVSHHGGNTSTQKITVTRDAAKSSDDWPLWATAGGAASLALVAVLVITVRRRRGPAAG